MNIVEYAKMRKMFGGGGSGGGDIDALIDGSLTEITSNAESVQTNAFHSNKWLTKIRLPRATVINESAFYSCKKLAVVDCPKATVVQYGAFQSTSISIADFPKVETLDAYAFYDCKSLKSVNFPALKIMSSAVFSGCSSLTEVVFPNVKELNGSIFSNCLLLKSVDFLKNSHVHSYMFNSCFSLTALILRSETMWALGNTNAFNSCYHFHGTVNSTYNPDGLKDGYIYVPRALIDSYKTATNWTTFATQFRALEDYTVDGTTTGELDESKVSL